MIGSKGTPAILGVTPMSCISSKLEGGRGYAPSIPALTRKRGREEKCFLGYYHLSTSNTA